MSALKQCCACGTSKPVSEFHRKLDGYQSKCRDCTRVYSRQYRDEHLESVRAYDRARSDRMRTPEGRRRMREYSKRWRLRHPDHKSPSYGIQYGVVTRQAANATATVYRALRKGLLQRASICSRCGRTGFIEAAHLNYNYPLLVLWLCRPCHRKLDAVSPKGGRE